MKSSGFVARAVGTVLTGIAMVSASALVMAQTYPDRPIKLVVPYPPGGVSDTAARLIASGLEKKLGTPLIIDNRAGAASSVASTYVANQPADGYTLYAAPVSLVINPALQGSVQYRPFEDFTPISMMMTSPFILQTHPSVPAKNVKELIELVKASPGKYAIGTSGMGSINHLASEYFLKEYGLDMLVVHYKGGMPAAQGLLGNQTQLMFSAVREALPLIESQKTNALAITSQNPSDLVNNIPTLNQATGSKDFEAIFWLALVAPAGLDKAIQDKLGVAMNELGRDEKLRADLKNLGIDLDTSSPQTVTANLKRDEAKWAGLIKELKPQ